ncbi:uncharacterized protein LOC117643752 [Thrips palmi]|uniref:Uncharacterized protein LOC117643752 n=1 Tax=Thrips palmi TaxID=161013 RepID=A0A6P8YG58_THRPL|nr:uncharacterized protein LOC117643752 [Thrips palmi]
MASRLPGRVSAPGGLYLQAGVGHADELPFLFPLTEYVPAPPSASDLAFSRTLLYLFTTFASTGAPTKDDSWPRVKNFENETEFAFLSGPGPVSVHRGFHNDRMARWAKFRSSAALPRDTAKNPL